MQYNSFPPQPSDPSGQPSYPGMQPYGPGQQSYPGQPYPGQPYPPAQQPFPGQQSYPPAQQPFPGQQPYPPVQQPQANQTYVVVNNSQKVNSGCAPWVIWLCIGVALLLCAAVAAPLVLGVIGVAMVGKAPVHTASTTGSALTDNQHRKVGEIVNITKDSGVSYTMQVKSVRNGKNSSTGDTYLIADIAANNTGNSTVNPNFLDFKLIDATGQTVSASGLVPLGKSLFGGKAQPGSTISGVLVFKIQPGQHNFTLSYNANELTEAKYVYSWDLQL